MINEDLNIFHYGGCGGMYFLHQLLITKKFNCIFKRGTKKSSFQEIRNYIFDIKNPDRWKETEIHIDNDFTLKYKKFNNKIFYNVNTLDCWFSLPGKKILVYTDLRSQIRLSWYKKSFWFWKTEISYKFFFSKVKQVLSDNKDLYYNDVKNSMKYADEIVKFQDLLTPEGLEIVLKKFGCDITQDNIDFLNHYLSLHPPKLLKKLGIET